MQIESLGMRGMMEREGTHQGILTPVEEYSPPDSEAP